MGKMKVKLIQCKISGSLVISDPKITYQISLYTEDIFDSKIVPKWTDVAVSQKSAIFISKNDLKPYVCF